MGLITRVRCAARLEMATPYEFETPTQEVFTAYAESH